MTDQQDAPVGRPRQLAWVSRPLDVGEHILNNQTLPGGITAEIQRLTIAARGGGPRDLVLRTYVAPYYVDRAERLLHREAAYLALLAETGVPAPQLVAVDPTGAHCESPSLLMTSPPGRTILEDEGLAARLPPLARQLVAIHRLQPAEPPPVYETLTTAAGSSASSTGQ